MAHSHTWRKLSAHEFSSSTQLFCLLISEIELYSQAYGDITELIRTIEDRLAHHRITADDVMRIVTELQEADSTLYYFVIENGESKLARLIGDYRSAQNALRSFANTQRERARAIIAFFAHNLSINDT